MEEVRLTEEQINGLYESMFENIQSQQSSENALSLSDIENLTGEDLNVLVTDSSQTSFYELTVSPEENAVFMRDGENEGEIITALDEDFSVKRIQLSEDVRYQEIIQSLSNFEQEHGYAVGGQNGYQDMANAFHQRTEVIGELGETKPDDIASSLERIDLVKNEVEDIKNEYWDAAFINRNVMNAIQDLEAYGVDYDNEFITNQHHVYRDKYQTILADIQPHASLINATDRVMEGVLTHEVDEHIKNFNEYQHMYFQNYDDAAKTLMNHGANINDVTLWKMVENDYFTNAERMVFDNNILKHSKDEFLYEIEKLNTEYDYTTSSFNTYVNNIYDSNREKVMDLTNAVMQKEHGKDIEPFQNRREYIHLDHLLNSRTLDLKAIVKDFNPSSTLEKATKEFWNDQLDKKESEKGNQSDSSSEVERNSSPKEKSEDVELER